MDLREAGRGDEAGWPLLVVASGRRRGQRGSILLLVLTVVLVLAIAVVGILNFSLNANVAADTVEKNVTGLYTIDGALEDAVNTVRSDAAACAPGAPLTIGAFEVTCSVVLALSQSGPSVLDWRTMQLVATRSGSSDTVARAQVRVVDESRDGQNQPGYSVEVCDWLLDDAVTETLQGCSA